MGEILRVLAFEDSFTFAFVCILQYNSKQLVKSRMNLFRSLVKIKKEMFLLSPIRLFLRVFNFSTLK